MSGDPDRPSQEKDIKGNILAQYKVFWNKPDKNRILVLQFPNRDRDEPYNAKNSQKPLALRIKPKSGLVEIEIPIAVNQNFDHGKGLEYGRALKKSKLLQHGGSFGLAGGFGPMRNVQRKGEDEDDQIGTSDDFDEASRNGEVMNKITLGGRMKLANAGDPVYAIGVFRGDELHLTRVDALCSLQPQFHHLDAQNDNERSNSKSQREGDAPAPESEARAVNMAVKSAGDEEEIDMNVVSKTLRNMQEESWQKLSWIDEDTDGAYEAYQDGLFLGFEEQRQRLVSAITPEQYLDAVSAPKVDSSTAVRQVMRSRRWSSDGESDNEAPEETVRPQLAVIEGSALQEEDLEA